MQINHLQYVFEVARAASFTAAAKALGISQPALSKMISSIEKEYGVILFERRRTGIIPTKIGESILRNCRVIFDEYRQVQETLIEKRDIVSGHVRLGASDTLCHHVVPDVLKSFCERYPGVDVTLLSGQSGNLLPKIARGDIDLGLFFNRPTEEGLRVQRLKWVDFSLVVSPDVPLPQKDVIAFLNKKLRYIGPIGPHTKHPQTTVTPLYRQIGLEPCQFIETDHQESPKELVKRNLGYTILPRYSVLRDIQSNQLREIPVGRKLGLYLHLVLRNQRSSRLIELFASLLKSQLHA